MKSKIYCQARYYEIAFGFVNIKKQVDLLEKFIKKYSRVKVKTILDIACGPAEQLREFACRNYKTIGLDQSQVMLDYVAEQAQKENLQISLKKNDMNKFNLNLNADFAYIMMGSIIYAKSNDLMLSHLNSVAKTLKSGGLYLIENMNFNWSDKKTFQPQSWIMKKHGITVKTTYQLTLKNALTQTASQMIKLEVTENSKTQKFVDYDDVKLTFPEEFKLLVEKNNKFEFLGFFERHSLKKLKKISVDNIVLLRKK